MRWAYDRFGSRVRRFLRESRAVAALEAAIATPVVLAILIGAAEFGNALYSATLIQTGVRDAARYLARTAEPETYEPYARRLAVTGGIQDGGTRRVSWWSEEDIAVGYRHIANAEDPDTGRKSYRGGTHVTVIQVSTRVDYQGLGTLAFIGQDAVEIAFAHEERWVGD